jgi:hypothetical protein
MSLLTIWGSTLTRKYSANPERNLLGTNALAKFWPGVSEEEKSVMSLSPTRQAEHDGPPAKYVGLKKALFNKRVPTFKV